MPKVVNLRPEKLDPETTVYIGRPSKWGNPFIVGIHGSRRDCISKFANSMTPEFIDQVKTELKGKNLACWCSPLPCHGDILLRIANV